MAGSENRRDNHELTIQRNRHQWAQYTEPRQKNKQKHQKKEEQHEPAIKPGVDLGVRLGYEVHVSHQIFTMLLILSLPIKNLSVFFKMYSLCSDYWYHCLLQLCVLFYLFNTADI
jgi:hypothetical protein